jgi:prepilin signal peptidase PulO-like enzyme (type II secretory pathway)
MLFILKFIGLALLAIIGGLGLITLWQTNGWLLLLLLVAGVVAGLLQGAEKKTPVEKKTGCPFLDKLP